MTTPNHIAGGLVFTGTMLSFYNINVFSSPFYLGTCVLASLISDIDSPKTITGRLFYPVAILINRKVGHRTLTHSLLFMALIWLLMAFLTRLLDIPPVYTKIFIFAFSSHLILDMLTIQGVPLFYPFRRNPCVLPADPAYRIKTNSPRSEIIAFTLFILLAFTMFPLFAQGFWTTYNRKFGTIAHCDRENTNSRLWVICEYDYIKNNTEYTGEAVILESNENKLVVFNQKEVFDLSTDDNTLQIIHTRPKLSTIPKRIHELNFMNIPIDSVNNLLSGRVCSGLLQSNYNVQYIDKGITYHTNFIKFSNNYNFKVLTTIDTARLEVMNKLESVKARIIRDSLQQIDRRTQYNNLLSKERKLLNQISNTPPSDLYQKNKLQTALIETKSKLKNFELKPLQIDIVLIKEKEALENELIKERSLLFSGYLTYYIFVPV
jgi:inner membrane protein